MNVSKRCNGRHYGNDLLSPHLICLMIALCHVAALLLLGLALVWPSPTYYPSLSPHSISIISTIAGTGTGSYSGDGGQATSSTIQGAYGIVIDTSGNVYFSDTYNNRVRKITVSTGIISTYGGTGSSSYNGDGGVASSASLYWPHGLCMDTSGNYQLINLFLASSLFIFQAIFLSLITIITGFVRF